MTSKKYRAALAGAAAGLANGLVGAGGGMLRVPLLSGAGGLEERRAFATALGVMTPLCLASLGIYALSGTLARRLSVPYLIGGFLGGILGGLLLKRVPVRALHGVLALLIAEVEVLLTCLSLLAAEVPVALLLLTAVAAGLETACTL